ncbi:hypothetical protein [Gemmatimonas groenlandica]|uniref:Uncharacterized protein n=1 Tax=Gemmatimonas groenlandica TaxID=2732249 RepID=A0A6M4ISG1_9BACT|nr:hypothetical protein [Gemmatimonas groenlandica]QJR37683.1 hypothetical protein HKW67_20245 [Gemmatimonas groenlandica]
MTTRRYEDDEVREIFSVASTGSTSDQTLLAESGGLTLDELQRIGREVGIDPTRVAHAAAQLDARGTPTPVKRAFGMPVGAQGVAKSSGSQMDAWRCADQSRTHRARRTASSYRN